MTLTQRLRALLNLVPDDARASLTEAITEADRATETLDALGVRRKEEGSMNDNEKMDDDKMDREYKLDEAMIEQIRTVFREEIMKILAPEADMDDEMAEALIETKQIGSVVTEQTRDNAELTRALIDVVRDLTRAKNAEKSLADRVAVIEAKLNTTPRRASEAPETAIDPDGRAAKEIRARSAAETAPDFLRGLYTTAEGGSR